MNRCDVCDRRIWPWQKVERATRVEVSTKTLIEYDGQILTQEHINQGEQAIIHLKCVRMI